MAGARPSPVPGGGLLLVGADAREVRAVLTAAADLLPGAVPVPDPGPLDHRRARAALAEVWDAVHVAFAEPADPGRVRQLVDVLGAVRAAEQRLAVRDGDRRDEALDRLRGVAEELRRVPGTEALLDTGVQAVCALGFDRAIVSRVQDGRWLPERVHVERDARWAAEILAIGQASPQQLEVGLVETEILRRRTAMLVDHVQERTGVNRPIADASLSNSYAAAPLLVGDEVVGFVHADCYLQGRDVDAWDRRLLAAFAEVLGQALARTAVLDRAAQVAAELGSWGGGTTTWGGAVGPGAAAPAARPAVLTAREGEVLRWLATGDTNARIARRLGVSEATVKSHVQQVLRKLGAANRAEAVARWHAGGGTA